MAQVISDATLTRVFNQGEIECSVEHPFLVERYSPAVTSGQNIISLPPQCIDIRRMMWMGWKMDPLPQRNYRDVFQGQNYQQGRPFWYIYNNVGLQQVQIFPAPNQNMLAAANPWLPSSISSTFVIEYYRASDNSTAVLPPWIRRQLLKIYVNKYISSIEGPDQSLRLAKYYTDKWQLKKSEFYTLLDALYSEARKLVVNQIVSNNYFPGSPVLPITKFGIGVDEGQD